MLHMYISFCREIMQITAFCRPSEVDLLVERFPSYIVLVWVLLFLKTLVLQNHSFKNRRHVIQ